MVDHPMTGTWVIVAAVLMAIVYFALLGCAVWLDFKEDKKREEGNKDHER